MFTSQCQEFYFSHTLKAEAFTLFVYFLLKAYGLLRCIKTGFLLKSKLEISSTIHTYSGTPMYNEYANTSTTATYGWGNS